MIFFFFYYEIVNKLKRRVIGYTTKRNQTAFHFLVAPFWKCVKDFVMEMVVDAHAHSCATGTGNHFVHCYVCER